MGKSKTDTDRDIVIPNKPQLILPFLSPFPSFALSPLIEGCDLTSPIKVSTRAIGLSRQSSTTDSVAPSEMSETLTHRNSLGDDDDSAIIPKEWEVSFKDSLNFYALFYILFYILLSFYFINQYLTVFHLPSLFFFPP